jgi:hypothetical protein
MRPAGGHEIHRFHRPQGDDIIVAATIAHHPDRFDRQEHRKRLAHLVVYIACSLQLLNENVISPAQQIGIVLAHLAENPHSQPGTGERMAIDHFGGQPNSTPKRRTSSLNSSRNGSTSFIRIAAGRPPTLWWDLMTCALPVLAPADSITSG